MKSILPPQIGANRSRMMLRRTQAVTQLRAHGTQKLPASPRGLQAQPGEGGSLITWNLPERYNDVTGYRVYVGSESNLAMQIKDRGTRQLFVPLQAGETPPQQNVFVSVVNGFREGPKQQIQTTALANTNVPGVKPQPSRDFLQTFSGGLDKTQSGQPTGAKTT